VAADLERALERAMAAEVPAAAAAAIDARVRAAIDVADSGTRIGRWRRRRVLAALAIAAILAGVAASPAIREYFDGWLGGTFESIWDRATAIDQAVIDDGYRVTLVRAYADPAGLRLALVAEDLEDRGWEEISVGGPKVTDDEGHTFQAFMGEFGASTSISSEVIMLYLVPPDITEARTRHLTATVKALGIRRAPAAGEVIPPEDLHSSVKGTWTFEFDLEFFGSVSAEPGVTASAAGIDVTLRRLSVMPSATIGLLEIDGLPVVESGWDPYFNVTHDGEVLDLWRLSPGSVGDSLEFEVQKGFDDLSGTWTITITEFHRNIPNPESDITTEEESIVGPWVLEFEGPVPVG